MMCLPAQCFYAGKSVKEKYYNEFGLHCGILNYYITVVELSMIVQLTSPLHIPLYLTYLYAGYQPFRCPLLLKCRWLQQG